MISVLVVLILLWLCWRDAFSGWDRHAGARGPLPRRRPTLWSSQKTSKRPTIPPPTRFRAQSPWTPSLEAAVKSAPERRNARGLKPGASQPFRVAARQEYTPQRSFPPDSLAKRDFRPVGALRSQTEWTVGLRDTRRRSAGHAASVEPIGLAGSTGSATLSHVQPALTPGRRAPTLATGEPSAGLRSQRDRGQEQARPTPSKIAAKRPPHA